MYSCGASQSPTVHFTLCLSIPLPLIAVSRAASAAPPLFSMYLPRPSSQLVHCWIICSQHSISYPFSFHSHLSLDLIRKVSFVTEVSNHNSVKFKRVNTRAARQGLPPLSAVITQDYIQTFPPASSRILGNTVANEGYYVSLLIQLFLVLLSSSSKPVHPRSLSCKTQFHLRSLLKESQTGHIIQRFLPFTNALFAGT